MTEPRTHTSDPVGKPLAPSQRPAAGATPPVALALSPHLDDAAFSCGGTLARLAGQGWQVFVCTAFTASVPRPSAFALACQLDKGLDASVDYMALRREEDRAACEALGAAAPRHLPFREAPHRGYESAAALFGPARPDDGVDGPLCQALAAVIRNLAPSLILAPQAVGGHVDHVKLIAALRRVAPVQPLLWWRDFPYTLRDAAPREPFAGAMARLEARAVPLDDGALARKRGACLAYRSQLGFQFGGEGGLDEKLEAAGRAESFRVEGRLPSLFERAVAAA